ncbi:hypothetical protein Pla108_31820 [Botrimarina colliarenosi]|uniref:Aerotolerance regulator N-terminal domain-containing protein n=1 Tax=Botrimarina colliarenosi TaxID=2528001 RepID=A0A5C6A9L4_9BACT|nr:BatA domain-containing protein [Botrimarina colliarenosi]TWT96100.1 hypothetical protein Pla108_31820 [Botrimarina colliarenosi]
MSFTFPALAVAGALLASLPIVIHLLNRRRRRRVAWAAMDFLLQSDRKNRTWVRLSEWLLLAARVVAIALAGLLAATPTTLDLLKGYFGQQRARHVVLLDDTCSMQRRGAGGSAWDEALGAVERLADAARQSGDELLVVRYADTSVGGDVATLVGSTPAGESSSGVATPTSLQVTNASASPSDGLDRAIALCEAAPPGVPAYAYVVSDFAETALRADGASRLDALSDKTAGLVLAVCGDAAATGNLAIESVNLAPGPLASGVETRLVIEVVNHSIEPAPAVALSLRRNGQPLTALEVGPFGAGERVAVETPVTFMGIGPHAIEATLPADRLPADDQGWLAVDIAASQPVLLVDDQPKAIESRVFAAALRPIGATRSGWAPRRVERLASDDLAGAAAVMLLDIERLSDADTQRLRDYTADGGGLLMVLGPRTDAGWFNQRIASAVAGEPPLTPWRLGPATSGPVAEPGRPVISVVDHPAVRVLAGKQNGFLPLVRLLAQRRLATDDDVAALRQVTTSPSAETPSYEVLARRLDGQPLLVESHYGAGRVLGLMTTAATGSGGSEPWSNLATLPIFPVLVNDITGWLAQERLRPRAEPIVAVASDTPPRSSLLRWDAADGLMEATPLGPSATLTPATPGVYRRVLGGVEEPLFAAQVSPAESDLRSASIAVLRQRWGDVARVSSADELFRDAPTPASRGPLYACAAALLGLLVGERWLAYRNSYVQSAARRGGAV